MGMVLAGGVYRAAAGYSLQKRGDAAREQHDHEKALASYSEALSINRSLGIGYAGSLFGLLSVHLAAGDEPRYSATADEIRQTGFDPAQIFQGLGDVFYEHDFLGRAIDEYEDLLELRHGEVEPSVSRRLFDAYFREGHERYARQILALAKQTRSIAGVEAAQYGEYMLLGRVFPEIRDPESAISSFESAIQLQPSSAEPYYELGRLAMARNAYSEAEGLFEMAIERDPLLADAYFLRGKCYEELGRPQEAVDQFKRAANIIPTHLEALKALAETAGEQSLNHSIAELSPMFEVYEELTDEILVVGYDLPQRSVRKGDRFTVTVYWRMKRGAVADPAMAHFMLRDYSVPNSKNKHLAVNNSRFFEPPIWRPGEVRKTRHQWTIPTTDEVRVSCQYRMEINALFNAPKGPPNWAWSQTSLTPDLCIDPG